MAEFAPEVLTKIGPLPITNTLVHTLFVDALLIGLALFAVKKFKKIPNGRQNFIEAPIEMMYNLTESIAGKSTQAIFPYIMSFFLFILVANWTSLLPGVGSIGFFHKPEAEISHVTENTHEETAPKEATHEEAVHEETAPVPKAEEHKEEAKHESSLIPLFRGATSDINVTLALALISVVATHMLSIKLTGLKDYLGRYFSWNPINLYVGILELIAELTKMISLSFRLFGNIFAGEVALHTVSTLFAFIFPLPFLLLETIVGVVQALVFSVLTLVFMAVMTTPHHPAHEDAPHAAH